MTGVREGLFLVSELSSGADTPLGVESTDGGSGVVSAIEDPGFDFSLDLAFDVGLDPTFRRVDVEDFREGGSNVGVSGLGSTLAPVPDFAAASELRPTLVPDSVAFDVEVLDAFDEDLEEWEDVEANISSRCGEELEVGGRLDRRSFDCAFRTTVGNVDANDGKEREVVWRAGVGEGVEGG